MMNLQREAYLVEHQRHLMAEKLNYTIAQPQPAGRLETKISSGIRLLGQIRGIQIHVTFESKEPAEQLHRINA
jgi:hypothetical protein